MDFPCSPQEILCIGYGMKYGLFEYHDGGQKIPAVGKHSALGQL